MELVLRGNFIDSDDAEKVFTIIAQLIKNGTYSGEFRKETDNRVIWVAIDENMPFTEMLAAYHTLKSLST